MDIILQWIDALWLIPALFFAHKGQRLCLAGLVLSGMILLRLQVELMQSMGYPFGMLMLVPLPLFLRGLAVYSLFYLGFLVFARSAPQSQGALFMAATMSVFFAAFFVSMFVMIL
jgi:hypothetical protein